jgi:DNA-binding beta-propeller fold protein YncE
MYSMPAFLSNDGKRLVLEPHWSLYPSFIEWYVVDTTNGRVVSHLKDVDHTCRFTWFDPGAQRAYCRVNSQQEGVYPVQLIAYDLNSGTKAEQLELAGVRAGATKTDRKLKGEPVWSLIEPGLAISPDGEKIVAVHADDEKVTTIDARRLVVERTISLKRQTSWLDLFPFAPAVAYAKPPSEGTIRQPFFGPDGRHLYVINQEIRTEGQSRGGLFLIDLDQGTIASDALRDLLVQWVQPAPDGRNVYAFGTTDTGLEIYEIRQTSPSVLWRLDARTLQPLAKREFTGYRGGRIVRGQSAH